MLGLAWNFMAEDPSEFRFQPTNPTLTIKVVHIVLFIYSSNHYLLIKFNLIHCLLTQGIFKSEVEYVKNPLPVQC